MSQSSRPLAEAIGATEAACRSLEQACGAAIDAVLAARSARAHEAARFVMDTWHVANATARILAHGAQYDPRTMAMLIGACRQIAIQCADACELATDVPTLDLCAGSARSAVTACNALLERMWDGLRESDRTAAA
jgi:hypothetical protein